LLGQILVSAGRFNEAKELVEGSLRAVERKLGPDSESALLAKMIMAQALYAAGDYAAAGKIYGQAIKSYSRRHGPDNEIVISLKLKAAEVSMALRDFAAARDLSAQAADSSERALGSGHLITLKSYQSLASAMVEEGEYHAANLILERAADTGERTLGREHYQILDLRRQLATSMLLSGEFAAARAILEQVSDALGRTRGPEDSLTLRAKNSLAACLLFLGEYARAVDLSTRLVDMQARGVGIVGPAFIPNRGILATALQRLGDYAGARAQFERTIEELESGPALDRKNKLSIEFNLGLLLLQMGDYEAGNELLASVVSESDMRDGPDSPNAVLFRAGLALSLYRLGKRGEAKELLEIALDKATRIFGTDHPGTISVVRELAAISLLAGEPAAAKELLLPALERAVRTLGPENTLTEQIETHLAVSCSALGDPGLAIFFMKLSVKAAQKTRGTLFSLGEEHRRSFLSTVERSYHFLFDLLMEEGRVEEALEVLDLLKDDELGGIDPSAAERRPAGDGGAPDLFAGAREEKAARAFEGAAAKSAAVESERAPLALKRAKSGLSEEEALRLAELEREADGAKKAFEALLADVPSLAEAGRLAGDARAAERLIVRTAALAGLGEGAALVYAVSAEETLHLVMLAPGRLVARKTAIGRDDLAKLVSEYRLALQAPSRDPRPAAEALYDVAVRPLADDLEEAGATTLMLSLDGALRYAPFGSLWDGERFLLERYATVEFTRSTPARMAAAARSAAGGGAPSAMALGVTAAWPGFPALPGVASEIAAVVGGGGSSGALAGESFLDTAFDRRAFSRSLASDAPVVHVASHFLLDPGSVDNSVLLLGDGGKLSLREIEGSPDLDFKGLDLLTLSACGTGAGTGRRRDGREVESLGEIVQRAGASAVLATLLPVDDFAAPELMREFYRLRYVKGMDKAEALRLAQLSVMRNVQTAPSPSPYPARGTPLDIGGAERTAEPAAASEWDGKGFSHPYYWAPYVLMGNWK
jgi:CHAT domain-containing protein/TolA-binding protein